MLSVRPRPDMRTANGPAAVMKISSDDGSGDVWISAHQAGKHRQHAVTTEIKVVPDHFRKQ